MKNYSAQNFNLAEFGDKVPMDFFHIQSQTSSNIDLFIKNYLARLLKICSS